ncbi:MAG TPA: efflux RND transporter periplasmic adaptor subunit [Anaerolineales bacterium]|jgi:HlyD family secretion protein|nr:efflux RND transporter periplasmic adaptor subunit [Anaerolineales bacterium]HMZ06227.1 efflux RND transporter periplasmic adaptor subunit [Anaerolineales bacterium]HNA87699.1 efflux RND transporter periplasmic adaptor subunit [Anaerolineales bacterium]HNB34650.1 efflux RND transporter periplasmic adaptor subunit [Anaerolineales bacterium]HNJ11974.1 efflux RND transporter periplasmic adaptor subunit [Anaerolineales bacterium]
MKKYFSWSIASAVVVLSLVLSSCGSFSLQNETDLLNASGSISAREVSIAPQIGGEVISISVEEGAQVKKGDELFRLDDSLLKAQRDQASAAVQLAEAALNTARAQYELTLNAARQQDFQNRVSGWNASQSSEFELPVWYFSIDEKIGSAKTEVDAARTDLDKEKANLEKVLSDRASQEFLDAEKRVADAQTAFLIAEQVLEQAKVAQDNEYLQDFAQGQYDAAETALNSAQTDYKRLLTTQAAADVLEARARVRVAQERYNRALDYYNSLLSGDQSLQVQSAESGMKQAEAALAQAQAALALIKVQMEKSVIRAPMDGVVLTRNLETGETAAPGGVVMKIGHLQEVELVVYIPETEYGMVHLGDTVSITVDSFPGETFTGNVVHISDQAEFTPRNVQTVEGRRATVYAVKLSVPNPDLKLKPGMPADVTFEPVR